MIIMENLHFKIHLSMKNENIYNVIIIQHLIKKIACVINALVKFP